MEEQLQEIPIFEISLVAENGPDEPADLVARGTSGIDCPEINKLIEQLTEAISERLDYLYSLLEQSDKEE